MPHAGTESEYGLDAVDFMRLLWSIEHGLWRLSKRMENEISITGPQRLVLHLDHHCAHPRTGAARHCV